MGASSTFGMVGGDVLLCQPAAAAAAAAAVSQYVLTATSSRGVSLASPSPLLATAGCTSGSGSTTSFSATRAVAAGGYAGALALTGDLNVIWAVGPPGSGSTTLAEHRSTGVGTVNLVTGASSSAAMLTLQAHGALMFAAWGVLAPLGVLAARYGKRLRPGPPPLWFTAHRGIQIAALVASLVGFSVAVAAVWGGAHFASPHAALGLAVFILSMMQALNAFTRPHPPKPSERKHCVRCAWEVLHKSSGVTLLVCGAVNVYLGLALYGAGAGLVAAYSVLIAALVVIAVWREIAESAVRKRDDFLALRSTPPQPSDSPPGIASR